MAADAGQSSLRQVVRGAFRPHCVGIVVRLLEARAEGPGEGVAWAAGRLTKARFAILPRSPFSRRASGRPTRSRRATCTSSLP